MVFVTFHRARALLLENFYGASGTRLAQASSLQHRPLKPRVTGQGKKNRDRKLSLGASSRCGWGLLLKVAMSTLPVFA